MKFGRRWVNQMKPTGQLLFRVVLFLMINKIFLTFESLRSDGIVSPFKLLQLRRTFRWHFERDF